MSDEYKNEIAEPAKNDVATDSLLYGEQAETELPPPEEPNEARRLNVGNIMAAAILAVVVVIGAVAMLSKSPKRRRGGEAELAKAGSKYIPEMRINNSDDFNGHDEMNVNESNNGEDIDKILETLPPAFQPQDAPSAAPVSRVGSGRGHSQPSYSRAERPDTRNSKSTRNADGKIAGNSYGTRRETNQNIVDAVMEGIYERPKNNRYDIDREQYAESIMSRLSGGSGVFGNAGAAQQQNKEQFFSQGQKSGNGNEGEYLSYASLWEGTIISGALETAINTDNPGLVIARVTENVYSSYDSSFLLIPEGTLLYAMYNSSVSYGQNRIQVAWNLLIRPDGYKVNLGNMNGVNAQGESGYSGKVNNHPFQILKALGLVWVYSMLNTELSTSIKDSESQYVQNAMTDTYSQVQKFGQRIVDRALDIKPTITIKSGTEIKFILNKTLDLPPVSLYPVTRRYVRTR